MPKYIIGNMTGNSMDAIDLVLTEFDGDKMTDICAFKKPYSKNMQQKIENLRSSVLNKTRSQIENLPEFLSIHDEYIRQIASCINEMCNLHHIDKRLINAIGFHGKTLDHNPPSKAKQNHTLPYTLQIGSGQMLADLTGIPVVYDFRSDFIMAGFDGAPLVPPHNAHISQTEGDGFYYNGGNTSNFALIQNGKALISADAGPFNEYIDNFIRQNTTLEFDKDGQIGIKGNLDKNLMQALFNFGRTYYETHLPKSGDPAYYYKKEIFEHIKQHHLRFEDAVYTLEYFAGYIAVQALTNIPQNIELSDRFILFGGGWKNPIVKNSFETILCGSGYVLPEHLKAFAALRQRFPGQPQIIFSRFGDYMEARLLADLARHKLENKPWELPETIAADKSVICGRIAYPQTPQQHYEDMINRAAKRA